MTDREKYSRALGRARLNSKARKRIRREESISSLTVSFVAVLLILVVFLNSLGFSPLSRFTSVVDFNSSSLDIRLTSTDAFGNTVYNYVRGSGTWSSFTGKLSSLYSFFDTLIAPIRFVIESFVYNQSAYFYLVVSSAFSSDYYALLSVNRNDWEDTSLGSYSVDHCYAASSLDNVPTYLSKRGVNNAWLLYFDNSSVIPVSLKLFTDYDSAFDYYSSRFAGV